MSEAWLLRHRDGHEVRLEKRPGMLEFGIDGEHFAADAYPPVFAIERLQDFVKITPRRAGTSLNGRPLVAARPLQPGDEIGSGTVRATVGVESDCAASRSGTAAPGPRARHRPAVQRRRSKALAEDRTLLGTPRVSGTEFRISIALRDGLVLGRSADCGTGRIDHPGVSRRHARIAQTSGGWQIEDLQSSNGTYVGGERTRRAELREGDRIVVGPVPMHLRGGCLVRTGVGSPRLVARDIGVRIGPKWLLRNVGLNLRPGEFTVILGPSGSGKSTLIQSLRGHRRPDEGRVEFEGQDLFGGHDGLRAGIGFVPQHEEFHDALTVVEQLGFVARLRLPRDTDSEEVRKAVASRMADVGLTQLADHRIQHLSGGQRKRLALAQLLLGEPSVLLLDEVTSGLDEAADREMMRLFRDLARSGIAVACVTHALQNIEEFADRIAVLSRGGYLAYLGPPDGIPEVLRVGTLHGLFPVLNARAGEEWDAAFRRSTRYAREVAADVRQGGTPPSTSTPAEEIRHAVVRQLHEDRRQYRILTQQEFAIARADQSETAMGIGLASVVALALALLFDSPAESIDQIDAVLQTAPTGPGSATRLQPGAALAAPLANIRAFLFYATVFPVWFGCNNAARCIVRERGLYLLARDSGLSPLAYLGAKATWQGLFAVIQAGMFTVVLDAVCGWPMDFAEALMWTTLAALVGAALGLVITTATRSVHQAQLVVPLVLIPQFLLAGFEPTLSGITTTVSDIVIPAASMLEGATAIAGVDTAVFGGGPPPPARDPRWLPGCVALPLLQGLALLGAAGAVLVRRDARGRTAYEHYVREVVGQALRRK